MITNSAGSYSVGPPDFEEIVTPVRRQSESIYSISMYWQLMAIHVC